LEKILAVGQVLLAVYMHKRHHYNVICTECTATINFVCDTCVWLAVAPCACVHLLTSWRIWFQQCTRLKFGNSVCSALTMACSLSVTIGTLCLERDLTCKIYVDECIVAVHVLDIHTSYCMYTYTQSCLCTYMGDVCVISHLQFQLLEKVCMCCC
jgi:hypothetical protein